MNTKKVILSVMALWAAMNFQALGQDQRRITIMSYNVENLFDTEDNPLREGDNTYLPRSQKGTPEHIALCERNTDPGPRREECLTLDWNDQVLARKLQNIATVIGRFEGQGPDILLLQEARTRASYIGFGVCFQTLRPTRPSLIWTTVRDVASTLHS